MLKQSIYPKTARVKIKDAVTLTEKLDGSNLGIFKKGDELVIALRENIVFLSEIDENPDAHTLITNYKGLYQWLKDHGEDLKSRLYDGSGFFGEWMSSSKLNYPQELIEKRWYVFAKARLTEDYKAEKISYDHDLFICPFENQEIPEYINLVPVIARLTNVPSVEELNKIYAEYTEKVGRNVEGIVISYYDTVRKYVRMKRGKLEDHHE